METDSFPATADFTSRFTNTITQEPVEMSMNIGDWKIDGQVVAHVFRDARWKGKRTYYLSIAQGMDMAVAVAACLYVHERGSEGSGSGSDPVFAKSDAALAVMGCCVS